jgi:hypothetical protein
MTFQKNGVRLLAATGALGFSPPDSAESFARGLAAQPDAIIADAGSADIGPLFLGADTAYTERDWEERDLDRLIEAAVRLDVPLIVGSCGGTGTDRAVRDYAAMADAIAGRREITLRTALIFAEQPRSWLLDRLADGAVASPTTPLLADLRHEDVEASDRLVAVMGAQPIRAALATGARLVLAGRACDDALFAAAATARGAAAAPAYLAGKLLENASLVAEPFALRQAVIADVGADEVVVEPMLEEQRCSRTSVAAQLMYERGTPFEQAGPGGVLRLEGATIEEVDERRVAVRGPAYVETPPALKVEGAGRAGFRSLSIAGCRDPQMIAALRPVIERMEGEVRGLGAAVAVSVFGRDAVMGDLEPVHAPAHEVGIVVETVAPTQAAADSAALLAKRILFGARYPGQKQSGGNIASMLDELLSCGPTYRWTVNHVVEVPDLLEPFRLEHHELGAGR